MACPSCFTTKGWTHASHFAHASRQPTLTSDRSLGTAALKCLLRSRAFALHASLKSAEDHGPSCGDAVDAAPLYSCTDGCGSCPQTAAPRNPWNIAGSCVLQSSCPIKSRNVVVWECGNTRARFCAARTLQERWEPRCSSISRY